MTRREEHLVSYGVALFSIYMRAPNPRELECYLREDGRHAVLYAFDGDEHLAAAEFELENKISEEDFSGWPYVEPFYERQPR